MITRAIFLVAAACLAVSEKFTYVPSKLDQVVYIYSNNVKKDKDLDVCEPGAVCGVVNQRFWLPPFVHRFCQCPKSQCPFSWSENDNKSIPLDNRSQLKTCDDTINLPQCDRTAVGLNVVETLDPVSGKHKKDVRILCKCEWPAYWKLNFREANETTTVSEYSCSQLKRCKSGQFCGHIRADTYSTYYQCSCPRDHWCINGDEISRNVSELLYYGPMMRAHCVHMGHENNL